uniref:RWD domain-containing protein n=1 Tax=Caenorhabditis tropicalis TaxID=1561998 RepID=A0A1I7T5I2_9PELO
MSTTSYSNSYYDPRDSTSEKKKKKEAKNRKNQKVQTPTPMWLLEACVTPQTANSQKWQTDFVPMATQLLLSNRPAHLIVRNSWNPHPFEHFPSKPETCLLKTSSDDKFVTTDAKVWSRQEIKATCEDCDFVSGNMWFYIPSGSPRSADELFANVVDPLLEWNRCPSGTGEAIGCAEDALALLHWNAPGEEVAEGLKKLAQRLGIVIENEDAMVIDCNEEDFSLGHVSPNDDMDDAPRRIPLFDWFWLGIALIILQLIYLASKLEIVRDWFSF